MKMIALSREEQMYRFCLPLNGANMYMLLSGKKALLIDCFRDEEMRDLLIQKDICDLTIFLTHEHWDHANGVEWIREQIPHCQVVSGIHAKENLQDSRKNISSMYKALITLKDRTRLREIEEANIQPYAFSPDRTMNDGEVYCWENHCFQFFLTPGHTSGSVCILLDEEFLFTGDSLVNGNKTITRFPSGSQEEYERVTIPFLEKQPDDRTIFPGHGDPDILSNIIHYIYTK